MYEHHMWQHLGMMRAPAMGWNSWNQVRCYDLTEQVVRSAADALVETGLRDKGYRYVVVDDCWQDVRRGPSGELRPHPERFPSGMAALASYVHERGLRFGIYATPGSETCAMRWDDYPGTGLGSLGHERQDAELFASWGVDFLKYDWCQADLTDGLEPEPAFRTMRAMLDDLERPMLYSIAEYGEHEPWRWAPGLADQWRTTQDLGPAWASVARVIDSQARLADFSGRPGGWNDPDMLQIGNGSLTVEECRSHFSFWAMLDAPLFLGTDIAALSPELLAIVGNEEVIAVDQDFGGEQGRRVWTGDGEEIWTKRLHSGGVVVLVHNRNETERVVTCTAERIGAPEASSYDVRDLWSHRGLGPLGDGLDLELSPHGVRLLAVAP